MQRSNLKTNLKTKRKMSSARLHLLRSCRKVGIIPEDRAVPVRHFSMTVANSYVRGMHDTRPWGTWEVIDASVGFCVKHICVVPGGVLSLQSHEFRSEHWVIVQGTASVILGESTLTKTAGEHIYVPRQTKHQIRNLGNVSLEFIEVQQGSRLDEGDITRYEDAYGRA